MSSYAPAGAPTEIPPREVQEKLLWEPGGIIQCINCKKPIYEVIKQIMTTSKKADLAKSLTPYSANVPVLRGNEMIHTSPIALNCPLCFAEGSVVIW